MEEGAGAGAGVAASPEWIAQNWARLSAMDEAEPFVGADVAFFDMARRVSEAG
jgi:hypothetical protein